MSKKPERTKAAPKVLDRESRKRQLKHHLDSLERDNFVALNEFEAIIATAAAAASAPGPVSLTHTNLPGGIHGLLRPLDGPGGVAGVATSGLSGSAAGVVGGAAGTGASGVPISGGRSKKNPVGGVAGTGTGSTTTGASSSSSSSTAFSRKPVLPRKPLNQLLEESGLARIQPPPPPQQQQQQQYHAGSNQSPPVLGAQAVNYLTAAMGPSQYPDRQFCSVCGWKGVYRCSRCGMRYCDLKCLKTHVDTRCMKFTI